MLYICDTELFRFQEMGKTVILSPNNKQGLTFASRPPEHLSVLGGF